MRASARARAADAPDVEVLQVRAAAADLFDDRVRQQLAAREVELDDVAERGQHAEHVLLRQLLPLVAHLRDDVGVLLVVRDLSGRDEPRAAVEDARPRQRL